MHLVETNQQSLGTPARRPFDRQTNKVIARVGASGDVFSIAAYRRFVESHCQKYP